MEKLKKAMMMVFAVAIFIMPVISVAGDLEPSAAPAPTMKTLDQIPPTWSIKLPASERFAVLPDFNNDAVLDKETGLVWQKAPSSSTMDWSSCVFYCLNLNLGGRKGWHLPTIEQLASLLDTSVAGSVKLPDGHPFTNLNTAFPYYFSSTNVSSTNAWGIYLQTGYVGSNFPKVGSYNYWCVRGGQSYDGQ